VEVIRHGKVRRAKLYYLRGRSGRAARIRERRLDREKELALMEQSGTEVEEEKVPAEAALAAEPEEAEPEVIQAQGELAPQEPEAEPATEEPEAKSQE
jgi:hypothetical protein